MLNSFILLAEHFIIPIAFLFWQLRKYYRSTLDIIIMTALVGVYVARLFYTGEWYMYGYLLRYVYLILFVAITIYVFIKHKSLPFNIQRHPREKFGFFFFGLFILVFLGITIWAYLGQSFSGKAIALQFPLKNGIYYVIEGGDSPVINENHRLPPVPEKYSLAFVKLDNAGKRAAAYFPDKLSEYYIHGETVYSPCDGIITAVVDSLADYTPPESSLKDDELLGNYIVIQNGEYSVYLGCLKQGSITVSSGDTVTAGVPVGAVGNSGVTREPHLSLQVTRPSTVSDFPWSEEGVPVLMEEQFLTKNQRVIRP